MPSWLGWLLVVVEETPETRFVRTHGSQLCRAGRRQRLLRKWLLPGDANDFPF